MPVAPSTALSVCPTANWSRSKSGNSTKAPEFRYHPFLSEVFVTRSSSHTLFGYVPLQMYELKALVELLVCSSDAVYIRVSAVR